MVAASCREIARMNYSSRAFPGPQPLALGVWQTATPRKPLRFPSMNPTDDLTLMSLAGLERVRPRSPWERCARAGVTSGDTSSSAGPVEYAESTGSI